MRTVGITMVRNEEDVIEHVVRHMLTQVDQVVVADNLSTDQTRSILASIDDKRLVVVDDDDPAYRQSEKMSALADVWCAPGDWVVPFDADELWNAPNGRTLSDWLRVTEGDVVVGHPWVHVPNVEDQVYEPYDCPFLAMPHRVLTPEVWPKAALRWHGGDVIEQGNHWTKSPMTNVFDIRHFQYRSFDHLARKVRDGTKALELTDLPADSGSHWRRFAAMSDAELETWWIEYTNQPMVLDPPRCLA